MARETHSGDYKTDQPKPLDDADLMDRDPEVILVDPEIARKEHLRELAFMSQWVTIRLEPSGDENAPNSFPVMVNGDDAEVLVNDRAIRIRHLPIGQPITVRRFVVEVIARAKKMTVRTPHEDQDRRIQLSNGTRRQVSQIQPFTIIRDPSPRGAAWMEEMIRRGF